MKDGMFLDTYRTILALTPYFSIEVSKNERESARGIMQGECCESNFSSFLTENPNLALPFESQTTLLSYCFDHSPKNCAGFKGLSDPRDALTLVVFKSSVDVFHAGLRREGINVVGERDGIMDGIRCTRSTSRV